MGNCNEIWGGSKPELHLLFTEFGFFHHQIINGPAPRSSWEGRVLGDDPSKASSACCPYHCICFTNPERGERAEISCSSSGSVREENKRPLTWWPVTNHHLVLPQVLNWISIPTAPLATSALNLNFFQTLFEMKMQ